MCLIIPLRLLLKRVFNKKERADMAQTFNQRKQQTEEFVTQYHPTRDGRNGRPVT